MGLILFFNADCGSLSKSPPKSCDSTSLFSNSYSLTNLQSSIQSLSSFSMFGSLVDNFLLLPFTRDDSTKEEATPRERGQLFFFLILLILFLYTFSCNFSFAIL